MSKVIMCIIAILLWCLPVYAIEKQVTYKHFVADNGQIRTQTTTKVLDDGKEISSQVVTSGNIAPDASVVGKDARTVVIMNKLKTVDIPSPIITGSGLEKVVTYDNSVTNLGHVQVRQITKVYEDGVLIGKSYHRHVISPGDDVSKEDVLSKAVAEAVHTQAVIDAYNDKIK
jgi:hypothetical protein